MSEHHLHTCTIYNVMHLFSIRTEDFTWVPLACLMLAAFSANLGAAPAPWILSVEYFPTSIRSQVSV